MTETEWNCASREQKNMAAEDVGLLRSSAFSRHLPPWYELPDEWKTRLSDQTMDAREEP